ncbi:MAG: hypothetical protein J2P17_30715, partial [Mycobacterium sp.]|nr:hypothetical protein [Mycobacterium sp.]
MRDEQGRARHFVVATRYPKKPGSAAVLNADAFALTVVSEGDVTEDGTPVKAKVGELWLRVSVRAGDGFEQRDLFGVEAEQRLRKLTASGVEFAAIEFKGNGEAAKPLTDEIVWEHEDVEWRIGSPPPDEPIAGPPEEPPLSQADGGRSDDPDPRQRRDPTVPEKPRTERQYLERGVERESLPVSPASPTGSAAPRELVRAIDGGRGMVRYQFLDMPGVVSIAVPVRDCSLLADKLAPHLSDPGTWELLRYSASIGNSIDFPDEADLRAAEFVCELGGAEVTVRVVPFLDDDFADARRRLRRTGRAEDAVTPSDFKEAAERHRQLSADERIGGAAVDHLACVLWLYQIAVSLGFAADGAEFDPDRPPTVDHVEDIINGDARFARTGDDFETIARQVHDRAGWYSVRDKRLLVESATRLLDDGTRVAAETGELVTWTEQNQVVIVKRGDKRHVLTFTNAANLLGDGLSYDDDVPDDVRTHPLRDVLVLDPLVKYAVPYPVWAAEQAYRGGVDKRWRVRIRTTEGRGEALPPADGDDPTDRPEGDITGPPVADDSGDALDPVKQSQHRLRERYGIKLK